ncbi:acyltransferase family protein [Paratractidigestivibacter sp.]|uniref:acyltransferase family protein n=1 Tax=Paratractidigestivibacter sp. TaxID=2847316 RepID=UPI002AC9172D|nr:acyltransferase family protein [Paratractidigestivibacter sp.]
MANRASTRDARIELLRLVAAAGIAVFHTFMPWFEEMTSIVGSGGYIVDNPVTCTALGFFNQLGSFGNNVFFMVSGLFLIPACARASRETGYWGLQVRRTARRAGGLLASLALYTAACLVLSETVLPVEGLSLAEFPAFLAWVEFMWVYLLFITIVPVIGWVWGRIRRPWVLVLALLVVVFCVNGYIAFLDRGDIDRDLLDWRKLMSAATYFAAFLAGGALSRVRLPRRRAGALLAVSISATVAVEACLACAREMDLMYATSFKSTSLLAFAMAVAAVLFARSVPGQAGAAGATPGKTEPASAIACRLAQGVLGFYIVQALTMPAWSPWFHELLTAVYETPGNTSYQLIAVGILMSLALLLCLLVLDQTVRAPLFRKLGLTK